jgi:hypothetical protein
LVEHDQRKLSMTTEIRGLTPSRVPVPAPPPLASSLVQICMCRRPNSPLAPDQSPPRRTHASTAQASTPAPRPPPAAASSSFGRQRIGPPPPRSPRSTTGLALRHHRLLLCHRPDYLGHSLLDAPVAAQLCAVVGSSSPRPRAPIGELNVSSLPGSSSTPMSLVGEVDVESLSGIAPPAAANAECFAGD